jgi:hypothetical protein
MRQKIKVVKDDAFRIVARYHWNGQRMIVCPKCIIRRITGLTDNNSGAADCSWCHNSGEIGCPLCEGNGLSLKAL